MSLPERTDRRDGLVLASAVCNISLAFIDGVHGDEVAEKVLPGGVNHHQLHPARVGSWRAHLNALSHVVRHGWSTALILEDDVDWDIRLRSILRDVAAASVIILHENQASATLLRETEPHPPPNGEPYGQGWDLLWLGHCGMDIPTDGPTVIREQDATVPEARHLRSWDATAESPLRQYRDHTRVVMHQQNGVCSLGYAVSQTSARRLLFELGLMRFDNPFDIMLRQWCDGTAGGERRHCITVLPQVFDHHRPRGLDTVDSDISSPKHRERERALTPNIQWSVRVNLKALLQGRPNWTNQWPDGQ